MELVIDSTLQEPDKALSGLYLAEWGNPAAKEIVLKMHGKRPRWILVEDAHSTNEPLKVWAIRIRVTTSVS